MTLSLIYSVDTAFFASLGDHPEESRVKIDPFILSHTESCKRI